MSFLKKWLKVLQAGAWGTFMLQGAEAGVQGFPPLKSPPAVFAVEDHYQVLVTTGKPSLVRLRVGENFYTGHINGVRPSSRNVHRFRIPMTELDKAGRYTVYCRPLPVRVPYMRKVRIYEEVSKSYDFCKLPPDGIRIFHLADTHGRIEQPARNALGSGNFDLLILNGDLVETSGEKQSLENPAVLAGKITGGRIPVIYARGNHELRGPWAEEIHNWVPQADGKLYYEVKLGSLWCMVLDGGEDKTDTHPAYGNTIECSAYRREQLEFIRKRAELKNHIAPSVRYRVVICHIPFPRYVGKNAADEENRRFTIYGEWGELLKKLYAPQLLLSGHTHKFGIENEPGFPMPVVMGARFDKKADLVSGARITLENDKAKIEFTDPQGKSMEKSTLML